MANPDNTINLVTNQTPVDNADVSALTVPEKLTVTKTTRTTISHLSKYNPDKMQKIIQDIATTVIPIEDIIKNQGLKQSSVYWWRALSPQILEAWRVARAHRTHIMADDLEKEISVLRVAVDEQDGDPRVNNNKIRFFDRSWHHKEWQMSKANRRDFGDKMEIDSRVTINPAEARNAAWEAHRTASPAEYEEVAPPPPGLNKARD